nr:uroporphyrinogen decarboxylase family protein [bacterium]
MDMQAVYQARWKRVADATAMKEPDRVPIIPVMEAFPVYYGGQTIQACMEDYTKTEACFDKFFADFKPDLGWDPVMIFPAPALAAVGINWFRWPGNGIDNPNIMYQYIEDEYMKADEYDEAIFDMTQFMMSKWMPRSFAKLQGLKKLYFRNAMWFGFLGTLGSIDDEVLESFEAAAKSARVLAGWNKYLADYRVKMKEQFGMPLAYGGFAYAPFDMIGDSLRGTEGILCDLYDQPDKVLKLIDHVTEYAIQDQIAGATASGIPYVWFWLHKGVDEFMSDEMYAKFYWPSLQRYIVALCDAGLVPVIYAEGRNTTRLKYFKDVPKGKVIYDFETMDMALAKRELGDVACIAGNLHNSLLTYGTPEQIITETRRLIDTCAPGGGFMLDTSCLVDDAKPENLMAMFETVERYGLY